MASPQAGRGAPIVAINVTPFVDVVLVLLVIFTMTARLDAGRALPLDLPAAESGEEAQRTLSIEIDADGRIAIDGVAVVGDDAFRSAVRARARVPGLRTVIAADERVHHGRVVHTLDLLRLCGIAKVAFAVERGR